MFHSGWIIRPDLASGMPGMEATSYSARVKATLENDEQSTSEKAIQNPTSSEPINPRVGIKPALSGLTSSERQTSKCNSQSNDLLTTPPRD
jgi:hypothetical protein